MFYESSSSILVQRQMRLRFGVSCFVFFDLLEILLDSSQLFEDRMFLDSDALEFEICCEYQLAIRAETQDGATLQKSSDSIE